jgi:hypothetical protein
MDQLGPVTFIDGLDLKEIEKASNQSGRLSIRQATTRNDWPTHDHDWPTSKNSWPSFLSLEPSSTNH